MTITATDPRPRERAEKAVGFADRELPFADRELPFPLPPTFDSVDAERKYRKEQLADGFKIFSRLGFSEGVTGHITVRDPGEPDTFWVNPFGMAFSRITASDLVRCDRDGNVVEGRFHVNRPAFVIHAERCTVPGLMPWLQHMRTRCTARLSPRSGSRWTGSPRMRARFSKTTACTRNSAVSPTMSRAGFKPSRCGLNWRIRLYQLPDTRTGASSA
jgi:hypothetical protein